MKQSGRRKAHGLVLVHKRGCAASCGLRLLAETWSGTKGLGNQSTSLPKQTLKHPITEVSIDGCSLRSCSFKMGRDCNVT
jgi:hypothetical protein